MMSAGFKRNITALLILFLLLTAPVLLIMRLLLFHPGDYKAECEKALSDLLKADVAIRSIDLHWGGGISLELTGIEIRSSKTTELLFRTPLLKAGLGFKDLLLRKRLRITSIEPRGGEIHVGSNQNGRLNWFESSPAQGPSHSAPRSERRIVLDLQSFSAADMDIHITDESFGEPIEIEFPHASLRAWRNRRSGPIEFVFAETRPGAAGKSWEIRGNYDRSRDLVSFKGEYDGEHLHFDGELYALARGGKVRFNSAFHSVALEKFLPEKMRRQEYLSGAFTGRFSGSSEGPAMKDFLQGLALDGAVDIRSGELRNINFVRECLLKLSPIPGFANLLGLGGEEVTLKNSLSAGDHLPFEILQCRLNVVEGRLNAEEIHIKHPDYFIEAGGSMGILQRDIDFKGKLVLMEKFSGELAEQTPALLTLQNERGRIGIPFTYQGLLPGATVQVDLRYIADYIIHKRGEELRSRGIPELNEWMERL